MIHPQMKNPIFVLFFFIIFLDYHYVSSQSPPPPPPPPLYPTNELFRPSLAIITGVFSIVFTLTLVLLVYAKCFHNDLRSETDGDGEGRRQDRLWEGLFSRSSRFSGLHKSVIESLPFFRFSALKGSKHGLECCVCLSKFEDVEILRLLPKCRHAFHIGCIDEWLEQHATCPLCRSRVSIEDDLSVLGNSNTSLRIMNSSENREEESNLEIYIEREEEEEGENNEGSSSRFSSFRKILKMGKKEKQFLDEQGNEKPMHKWKHRIVVSDAVLKNRWSNVTPSDLTYLTAEMLNSLSSDRFTSIDRVQRGDVRDKEDRKMKEKETSTRTMSEIVTVSREGSLSVSKASTSRNTEERRRQIWLPIARRTAQWFVNREKSDTTRPSPNLNV